MAPLGHKAPLGHNELSEVGRSLSACSFCLVDFQMNNTMELYYMSVAGSIICLFFVGKYNVQLQ